MKQKRQIQAPRVNEEEISQRKELVRIPSMPLTENITKSQEERRGVSREFIEEFEPGKSQMWIDHCFYVKNGGWEQAEENARKYLITPTYFIEKIAAIPNLAERLIKAGKELNEKSFYARFSRGDSDFQKISIGVAPNFDLFLREILQRVNSEEATKKLIATQMEGILRSFDAMPAFWEKMLVELDASPSTFLTKLTALMDIQGFFEKDICNRRDAIELLYINGTVSEEGDLSSERARIRHHLGNVLGIPILGPLMKYQDILKLEFKEDKTFVENWTRNYKLRDLDRRSVEAITKLVDVYKKHWGSADESSLQ